MISVDVDPVTISVWGKLVVEVEEERLFRLLYQYINPSTEMR